MPSADVAEICILLSFCFAGLTPEQLLQTKRLADVYGVTNGLSDELIQMLESELELQKMDPLTPPRNLQSPQLQNIEPMIQPGEFAMDYVKFPEKVDKKQVSA